jgi:hemerythrin-like metal-binding protein
MWYTTLSVGVLEIDLQHANIDQLLFELTDENRMLVVDRITNALIRHFLAEERLCAEQGLLMTDEHRREHERLSGVLRMLQDQIKKEDPDRETILRTYSNILVEHVTRFDAFIGDTEASGDEDSPEGGR